MLVINCVSGIEKYIDNYLDKNSVKYVKENEKNKRCYVFAENFADKRRLIIEVISTFYKFFEISKAFSDKELDYNLCCYLGAILGLEADEERKKISKALEKDDFIDIEGIYNFCLQNLKEDWQNLAVLSVKLYAQCKTREDIFSLTSFMMGVDEKSVNIVELSAAEKVVIRNNGEIVEAVPYTDDEEKNILLTVLSFNPSDIVINGVNRLSKKFVSVIQTLGEEK